MNVQEKFPEAQRDGWFSAPDYDDLLAAMAKVIVGASDKDYQGDTLALLERDGKLGYLRFGWGSCSGCDALQGCDTFRDLQRLADELEASIVWFDDANAARAWIEAHDWEGSRDASKETIAEFLAAVRKVLP